MSEPVSCSICRSRETDLYCIKDRYRIRRCRSCCNGFLVSSDGAKDPTDLYRSGYHRKSAAAGDGQPGYDDYFAMAPAFRRTFRDRFADLLALQAPRSGAELLDVGCGPGYFLEQAASRYKVTGIELGREAVEYARGELGLEVLEAEFSARLFAPQSFDAVTMFDTIEHLADPAQALADAHALLRPNGLLLLTTGDFSSLCARLSGRRWHLLTPPEHLSYFTRAGLCSLLECQGFEIVRVSYPYGHFTLDYLAERLVKSLGVGLSYRWRPALRRALQNLIIPMSLWDIMLISARKRGLS